MLLPKDFIVTTRSIMGHPRRFKPIGEESPPKKIERIFLHSEFLHDRTIRTRRKSGNSI